MKTFAQTETFPVKSLQIRNTTMTFAGKKACKDQFPQTSYENGPDVEIRLTALKIGDLILCGISGELMTEIGMEIKRQSPYSGTLVVTHCNGSSGYICTDKSSELLLKCQRSWPLLAGINRPFPAGVISLLFCYVR
jgi:hypothetical protein